MGMWKTGLAAASISMGTIATGFAANNYDVNFTLSAPAIDGHATDAAWGTAASAATNFVKHDDPTLQSLEQTRVRALWDATHLYLLFEADDAQVVPSPATADDTGFLFSGIDDVEVFLDPSWTQGTAAAQNNKVYHVAVNPTTTPYTYTEAGNGQLDWALSAASQVAFSQGTSGWTVEMAIAWTDLNSTASLSPGVITKAPVDGTIWGAQFGRVHSLDDPNPNNAGYSKWQPTSGSFRQRPLGTLTFKGGREPVNVNITTGTVTYFSGFEQPVYTANTQVVGTDDWTTGSGTTATWIVSDEKAFAGQQSLKIVPNTAAQTLNNVSHTTNTATPQYMHYQLYLPSEQMLLGSYRHVIYLQGLYSSGALQDAMGQIWFRNNTTLGSNDIAVISYESAASETATSTTEYVGLTSYDRWMPVTVKAYPVEKKFEVWVNGYQLHLPDGSTMFGVKRRSAFQQLAFGQLYGKNYGTEPVFVDNVTYVEDPPASAVAEWMLY